MCLAIKNKSKLFQKTKELNDKYKNQFNTFKKEINIHNRCNTLIKYKSSCNKENISNYLCKYIIENEEAWRKLYNKSLQNKQIYDKYIAEYTIIKNFYGKKSYKRIKKYTYLFSKKQYYKFEEEYCKKRLLKPLLSLCIILEISYISPAGRNHYITKYKLINKNIDRLFIQIDNRKIEKETIKHQRALMSYSKRYDILTRDHYKCQICGRTQNDGAILEVDHIMPVSKGGLTTDENLQTLCHECNQGKKAKIPPTIELI